jgi:alpha-1,6-mannosyltransferase
LFYGHVAARETLARLYASCDVFVHPNPREPFGIGPLEAMASGVPVVLPDAGGVLSYARTDNAWLAAAEPHAFADAVSDACARPDANRVLAARRTAEQHDWPRVARDWFSLYDQLIASRRSNDRGAARSVEPGRTEPESVAVHAHRSGVAHRTVPES